MSKVMYFFSTSLIIEFNEVPSTVTFEKIGTIVSPCSPRTIALTIEDWGTDNFSEIK